TQVLKETYRLGNVCLAEEGAVAAGVGVEVQGIHVPVGADPFVDGRAVHGAAGTGDGADVVAYQGVGNHVGGEDDAFLREVQHRHVVAVVLAGVQQFHGLAAECQGHALAVVEIGFHHAGEEFLRRYDAVTVQVDLVEELRAHAADARVGEGGVV